MMQLEFELGIAYGLLKTEDAGETQVKLELIKTNMEIAAVMTIFTLSLCLCNV